MKLDPRLSNCTQLLPNPPIAVHAVESKPKDLKRKTDGYYHQIIYYTRCITPKRVTSLQGPIFASLRLRATQFVLSI